MSKYFLYIDESKDYKHNTLYLGGLLSLFAFSGFEKICKSLVGDSFSGELKSTQAYHREFFQKLSDQQKISFVICVEEIVSHSDTDYLDNLIEFIRRFLQKQYDVSEITIYADFTRLSADMRKTEKAFSKKLTHHFKIPIEVYFKNSSMYRCIQFADLAVGCKRRQKNIPAVDVSQSESKTSLRTTFRGLHK